jgi:hypothetical protein
MDGSKSCKVKSWTVFFLALQGLKKIHDTFRLAYEPPVNFSQHYFSHITNQRQPPANNKLNKHQVQHHLIFEKNY